MGGMRWLLLSGQSCYLKQKRSDEMRMRDWSSDVCASDLPPFRLTAPIRRMNGTKIGQGWRLSMPPCPSPLRLRRLHRHGRRCEDRRFLPHHRSRLRACRSEEHTSELQSLMRISYAVFCLKKKKTNSNTTHQYRPQKSTS